MLEQRGPVIENLEVKTKMVGEEYMLGPIGQLY